MTVATPAPLPLTRSLLQYALGCLTLLLCGAFYSLGVFSAHVDDASPSGELHEVWPSALALLGVSRTLACLFTGMYLHSGKVPVKGEWHPIGVSKTDRLRVLFLVSSAAACLLCVAGYGVAVESRFLINAGVCAQGIALGALFLIGLEILACCFPNNAGLAVGSGSMTAGFGSIGFTAFFEWSVEKYGCVQALYMSGFVISTAIFLISIGVVWPQELCTSETIALTGIHLEDDNVSSGKLLDWSTMIKMPQFYMYSFLLLAEQAGYAFFAFFFVIGKRFGKESSALANAFEAMLLLGTVSRPVVGLLADKLSWGKGRFSIGSRNIMRILMLTQAVAYFGLIPASNAENYGVFSWCVAMIIMVFFCASGMALVLAKDIFGAGNSSLVFGAACSIGYGIGSFVWTKAVSVLEISGVETARAYNRFYWVAGLFNVVGIVSGVLLTRYEEGFERMPKKIFADIQIRGYGSLGGKVEEECLVELV